MIIDPIPADCKSLLTPKCPIFTAGKEGCNGKMERYSVERFGKSSVSSSSSIIESFDRVNTPNISPETQCFTQ